MTPELSILKLLLNYEQWCSCKGKLSIEDFPKDLQGIYSCIDNYHASHPDTIELSGADLANLVFSTPHKDKEYVAKIVEQVDQTVANEKTTHQLINAIREGKLLKQLSLSSYEVAEGRLDREKFRNQLDAYVVEADNFAQSGSDSDYHLNFVTDDLQELVTESIQKPGLRWRLKTLNEMLGSLRKGDFGVVFARPETGKTTFLASEVTFMATQLVDPSSGPILWINNEEQGSKVMLRCYQAALGLDLVSLYSDISKHKDEYSLLTHNKIKLFDSGVVHKKTVEELCAKLKPSLIVADQLDKVTGFTNDREDLRLGGIYQWARELAKQYCPVIGICQADGSGEGVRWLTMGNVANAKTAKQAEADWILGIGKVNDVGYDQLRFLHLSKNKLVGDLDSIPDQRHGKRECLIEPSIARYKDITL